MRLIDAILSRNGALVSEAGQFSDALPLVVLTCIDTRLNHLFPEVLGLRETEFIWLRNAGNIVFDPMSSMTRSIALACAIKGGREIAVIGHSDCKVRATPVNDLISGFASLGIERSNLPDNLVEFFGLFASERQNIINGVEYLHSSPLLARGMPIHGLFVDISTKRLEWVVNGYQPIRV